MKQKKIRKPLSIPVFITVYLAVIAVCIALDQITKHFIEKAVSDHNGTIRILGDWLTFVWRENDGATGSLFSNLGWQNWLFFFTTLVGIPVFCFLLWRSRTRSVWGQVAFAFVIGGTIGNAIDRMFLAENGFFTGKVRDFIRVEGFFGIFNVADSFLVVGVILALLAIVFFDPDSLLFTFIKERKAKIEQSVTDETAVNTEAEQAIEEQIAEKTDENDRADV